MARRRKKKASSRVARALGALRGRRRILFVALGLGLLALAIGLLPWRETGRSVVRRALEPASLARVERYAPQIRAAAREHAVDACLIAGIVYTESRGRADAVSSAGALGLMQLVPAAAGDAARALGLPEPSADELLADPALNIRLGTRHFAWTLRNEGDDPERALCAYNAGRARLAEWLREAGGWKAWRAKQEREGDSQVLAYARAVLEEAEAFRKRGAIEAGREPE